MRLTAILCAFAAVYGVGAKTRDADSLSDVAALRRYAAENAKVAAPVPGENRVVFVGDSITDFWGPPPRQILPGRTRISIAGSGGQGDAPQLLLRFRQDVIAPAAEGGGDPSAEPPISAAAWDRSIPRLPAPASCRWLTWERAAHNIRVVLSSLTPR